MSFQKYKSLIEVGDTVMLYYGFANIHHIRIHANKVHQSKFGALKHNDLIGKPFGGKFNCSKGWLYALYPTPELWTLTLPHRTQILYSTDISMVTLQLDLKPGSVVIESGTGSASLSHALIRTIAPTGHLYTFDFHEERCRTAIQEFQEHGIGDLVTCSHRDVCSSGFELEDVADAVFLDLPEPWSVIPFAKQSIRKQGGRLCSFSPCIEQVKRTCETLEKEGFCEITAMECLTRSFDVRTINMPVPDLGFGPGKSRDFENVGGSFQQAVIGRTESNTEASGDHQSSQIDRSEILDSTQAVDKTVCNAAQNASNTELCTTDRSNTELCTTDRSNTELCTTDKPPAKKIRRGSKGGKRRQAREREAPSGPTFVFKTGLAPTQMPGHTGYLTFASLYTR